MWLQINVIKVFANENNVFCFNDMKNSSAFCFQVTEFKRHIYGTNGCFSHSWLVYAAGPYVSLKCVSYINIGIAIIHILAFGYITPESPVFYVTKGEISSQ